MNDDAERPSWWLDERVHAGPEHLDPEAVARYEAKAGYDPTPDIEHLRAFGLGPGCRVVDLGAGIGTFALAAAATGAAVTAVDVSPAMVAELRRRSAAAPAPIDVVEAGFLTYAHDGPPADIVFSRNALHQLPDPWKPVAIDRLARILRPGGILRLHDLVLDVEPSELEPAIERWLEGAVDDPRRGYTADDFVEHLQTEFSTYTWLLEPMLERAGFEILERQIRRSIYATYMCRSQAG